MARKKTKSKEKPSRRSKPAPEPEADVLEEVDAGGPGVEEGIVFTTFVLLAGALYLMWTLLDGRYPDAVG